MSLVGTGVVLTAGPVQPHSTHGLVHIVQSDIAVRWAGSVCRAGAVCPAVAAELVGFTSFLSVLDGKMEASDDGVGIVDGNGSNVS